MQNEREKEIETLLQVIPAKQRQLYTKEQAKMAALATLNGIHSRYDLNGEPLAVLVNAVKELIQQTDADLRCVPTFLEREQKLAANNEKNIYLQWCTADWALIRKNWEASAKDPLERIIEIPILDPDNGEPMCLLRPMAFENETGAVSKAIDLHFPAEDGDVGRIFSTSKACYREVTAWRKELDKEANPYSRIDLAFSEGAAWRLPLYERVGEKKRESLAKWIKIVLQQKAKREIELSKVTTVYTPDFLLLKGISGDHFIPGFRLELSRYARETIKG